MEAAGKPQRSFSSTVPVQRGQVLRQRSLLIELAQLLDADEHVNPRGVVLIQRVLTDGASPLYTPAPPGTLEAALRHARAALLLAR